MKVVAAAIRDSDGNVHSLPPPARHNDVIQKMRAEGIRVRVTHEQGFLLEDDTFVDRVEAAQHAMEEGQATKLSYSKTKLYSEDLW